MENTANGSAHQCNRYGVLKKVHRQFGTLRIREFGNVKRVFLSLIGVLAIGSALFGEDTLAPAIRKAPEVAFTVPGQGQKLLSQFRGKVIALEFIFTTCPHCQAASHVMSRMQKDFGPRGFQAIDIAFNDNSDLLVSDFAKEQQTIFPVGWTTRDQVLSFMGISTVDRFVVPQLILIDREGMIHYQTPPLGDEESYKEDVVRKRVELLLNASAAHQRKPGARHSVVASKR
jgi:thiol-disulfide isomerase/thioredoxin